MKLELRIKIERFDKTGKKIDTIEKPLNSYVQNFVDMLKIMWNANNNVTITATSGSANIFYCWGNSFTFDAKALAADDTYGILVGTGTNAVAISNYALQTKVLHGDVTNKLNYGAMSIGNPATVGTERHFTMARTLTNNSGADITIEEIGLALQFNTSSVGGRDKALIERSLLAYTIPSGQSATFTYTIAVAV